MFGVAISNYLTKYQYRSWKHKGDYWGTLKSTPPTSIERMSLWDRLKHTLKQVGSHLVKITIQKASDDGVDPITGWFKVRHDTEYSAKAIMILRNAPELVDMAQSFKIYLRDKYENREFAGVVLTQDSISFMDRFSWKNELYKIWDTEDHDDGYNFSFRIGYLEWLPK